MATSAGNSPKARALGAELRQVRNAAGVGVRQLARRLQTNHVKLSRYETGARVPTPEEVVAYLAALGSDETQRERLTEMARSARESNWLTSGVPSIHRQTMSLVEFERTAVRIFDVAPLLVPGLLQTEDYARVILNEMPVGERESRVALRMGRRDVLMKKRPVCFTAIVAEQVLREPVGGPGIMAGQLHHIGKLAELPNVAVHVLNAGHTGWHLAREGPFLLFEFSKGEPIVNLEHYRSPAFVFEENVVRDYVDAVTVLKQQAMAGRPSVEFIRQVASEMEERYGAQVQ